MTLHLTNFFQGGYESNQKIKKRKNYEFLSDLTMATSYIDPDGFMRVNHKYLGPAYNRKKRRLEDSGVIEIDRSYIIGEKPQGYKVNWSKADLHYLNEIFHKKEESISSEYVEMDKVSLDTGAQVVSIKSTSFDPSIEQCLTLQFIRGMVISSMAPIQVEDGHIVTPTKKAKALLFNFLHRDSNHIIDDKRERRPFNASALEGKDCFWYKNSRGREYCVIGSADDFIEATTQSLFSQAYSYYLKVKYKRAYCFMNLTNGRSYHTLTNMPRWMRPFLLIDGKPTLEKDMANENPNNWHVECLEDCAEGRYDIWEGTKLEGVQDYQLRTKLLKEGLKLKSNIQRETNHPLIGKHPDKQRFLIAKLKARLSLIKENLKLINEVENIHPLIGEHPDTGGLYLDDILAIAVPKDFELSAYSSVDGTFYKTLNELGDLKEDDDVKKIVISVAYDKTKNNYANKAFEKAFPTLKRWIDWRKEEMGNQEFAVSIQRRGAYAWDLATDTLFYKYLIKFIAIHDSVIVRKDQEAIVDRVLQEALIETYWLGFTIKTK